MGWGGCFACGGVSLGFNVAKCTQEIATDFHNNAKFKMGELGHSKISKSMLKSLFIQYDNKCWKVLICLLLSESSGHVQHVLLSKTEIVNIKKNVINIHLHCIYLFYINIKL